MAFKFSLPKASQIFAGVAATLRRFPMPMACAILWAAITMTSNHGLHLLGGREETTDTQIFLLLGFFWGLAATLYGEARGWNWAPTSLLALPGYVLLILVLLPFGGDEGYWLDPTLFFLEPALVLLVMAAPFLPGSRATSSNLAFWDFNRASWVSAAFGYLVGMVAALGLMFVLYALEELFGIDIPARLAEDVWVLALGLLWPWRALAGIPGGAGIPSGAVALEDEQPPKWVSFLASYLLVPLAVVYLLILYAYIAKIAIDWELPKGQVGYLVSGFAIAGVIIHLFSHPLAAAGRPWVRLFQRHFYHALWGPLLLLWLAVGTRIADYGVTESRYLIALFAFWLTLLCLYFTLRGRRLILVPLSLSLLLAAASFGPWGAAQISTRSQLAEFTGLMESYGRMRDGKVRATGDKVPFEAQKRITSIVYFFQERGQQAVLQPLLADLDFDAKNNNWRDAVLAAIDLPVVDQWQSEHSFNYNLGIPEVLALDGHDVMIRVGYFHRTAHSYPVPGRGDFRVTLSEDRWALSVEDPGGRSLAFDIAGLLERLRDDNMPVKHNDLASQARMTLEASNGGLSGRLILESLNARLKDGEPEFLGASAILLLSID